MKKMFFTAIALRNIDLPLHHQLQQLQLIDEEVVSPVTFFEEKGLEEIKKILKR
jgi:hypothetical protein